MEFPLRYLPTTLSRKDTKMQTKTVYTFDELNPHACGFILSKCYPFTDFNHALCADWNLQWCKQHKYYKRRFLPSYKHKTSKHIRNARNIYNIQDITPSEELARKTGCSLSSLKQIVRKGEGAYYSSGSRPNQTPQSWGLARLASALTAGKSAAIDYEIIKNGCNHNKTAFILANKSRKKRYTKTRKRRIRIP